MFFQSPPGSVVLVVSACPSSLVSGPVSWSSSPLVVACGSRSRSSTEGVVGNALLQVQNMANREITWQARHVRQVQMYKLLQIIVACKMQKTYCKSSLQVENTIE